MVNSCYTISQIRERVIQTLNTAKQSKSLQDVVREEPLPSLGYVAVCFAASSLFWSFCGHFYAVQL